MLERLIIKNYLLLKNIEIDFSNRFNVITGETGAGKSILINSFGLLFGERADYSIISKNKEKMMVEGIIKLSKNNKRTVNKFLKDNEIEVLNEEQVIIRRELYAKAYSRNFINDSPVGTGELKQIGDILIDIHSQNEHQSLLKKEIHIELLDLYLEKAEKLKFGEKLSIYSENYNLLTDLIKEYDELKKKKGEIENKSSFMEFQLKEISETDPVAGEDELLENELKTSENIESIQQGLTAAYSNLYDDTGSVIERIKIVEKELQKISGYNSDIQKILDVISESSASLNESGRALQGLVDSLNHDPERIEQIRERLYKLQFLKKKYGGSIDEVLKLKAELEENLSLAENFDKKIGEHESTIKAKRGELLNKAKEISKIRKDRSKQLEQEIEKVLKDIGLENAEFKVSLTPNPSPKEKGKEYSTGPLSPRGIDDVEFIIKVNKGDEFTSLRKTASGGEVSRIMLAIKAVLSEADKTGVLVFDEIDTGISGRIATKVGGVMKRLSASHQIIAITHLAQIAAIGDEHLLVEKEIEGQSTITKIRTLDKNEKVIEIAKLLSGEKVTDASIKSAKELIEN
jgi:DNA repair protein RecN (Recombination protein N)